MITTTFVLAMWMLIYIAVIRTFFNGMAEVVFELSEIDNPDNVDSESIFDALLSKGHGALKITAFSFVSYLFFIPVIIHSIVWYFKK